MCVCACDHVCACKHVCVCVHGQNELEVCTYLSTGYPHGGRTGQASKDQRLTCPHAIPMPCSPVPSVKGSKTYLLLAVPCLLPHPMGTEQDRFSSKGSKTYLSTCHPHALLSHPMGTEQDRFSSKGSKTYLSTCHPHATLSHPMGTEQDRFSFEVSKPYLLLPVACLLPHPMGTEQDRFSSKGSKTYLSTRHPHATLSHPMWAGQVQFQSVGTSILQVKWENVAVNILCCLILKTT